MKIVSKFFYYNLLTITLKISVNMTISKMIISVLNYFSAKKKIIIIKEFRNYGPMALVWAPFLPDLKFMAHTVRFGTVGNEGNGDG